MNYVKGKLKKLIFHNSENGYVVALFRVKETNEVKLQDKVNKIITITGVFTDVNLDILMTLYGNYSKNEKFGMQYVVKSYEIDIPTSKEAIVEFLSSNFIDGCGEKTAKRIVDTFGEDALNIIKENIDNLFKVEGMTPTRAGKIYNSLMNYSKSSDAILKFQNLGFTIEECSRIYNRFKNDIDYVLNEGFYDLKEVIDFYKLDNIYINNFGNDTKTRISACIIESMEILSNIEGDTFYYQEEIKGILSKRFNIVLEEDTFNEFLEELVGNNLVVVRNRRIYLKKYDDMEQDIARMLKKIDSFKPRVIKNLNEKLKALESKLGIDYNQDQEKAIINALDNNITIISGGPGTGKTTIINAIVKLYIEEYKLGNADIMETIALLAPTGRASKKMATATHLPASTIHRYLKWYKDRNDFFYNEYNKTKHRLIIVDEVSMIDIDLFDALLKGISPNIKLILVGDTFQLPSVGPGLVLNDLIDSDYFNFVPLNQIYRQSDNSYIPYLAKEIKNNDLSEEFLTKRDDYTFVRTEASNIRKAIEQIINISLTKNIDEANMQVLAPMYRGENGINNLNETLQNIYNPSNRKKEEIKFGDVIYREGDKVLQLVNDLDNNVFNGDIGFIETIWGNKITIDFEGNEVTYDWKDLKQIKHAYAITVHKSQGSEFEHVIMPVTPGYYKMLYNKLIYTGVSRAKKSLTIVGDPSSFVKAVGNNYSANRKTSLKERIIEVYNS